jgi:PleD family two-component response regulator
MADHLKLPTLLVVTDNSSIRSRIRKELDSKFFVLDASTESKTMEIARTTALEFVILDSLLEECDWSVISQAIRNSPLNVITPIYLITGRLNKTFRREAKKLGVTDFLMEQIDSEELQTKIAVGRKTESVRNKTSALFNQKNNRSNEDPNQS